MQSMVQYGVFGTAHPVVLRRCVLRFRNTLPRGRPPVLSVPQHERRVSRSIGEVQVAELDVQALVWIRAAQQRLQRNCESLKGDRG